MEILKHDRRRQRLNLLVDACSEADGINDQMTNIAFCGGDLLALQRDEPFTIAFWFKQSTGLIGRFFSRFIVDSINTRGLQCYTDTSDRVYFDFRSNVLSFQAVRTNGSFRIDDWNHVIISYDGTNSATTGLELYLNGELDIIKFNQTIGGNINYTGSNFKFWSVNSGIDDTAGQHQFYEGRMFLFQTFADYMNQAAANDLYNQAKTKAQRILGFRKPGFGVTFQHYENLGLVSNLLFAGRFEDSGKGPNNDNASGFMNPTGGWTPQANVVKDAPEHGS
jgi:hypothetical protein